MDKKEIYKLLEQVEKGQITKDDAVEKLKIAPFEDLEFAKIDHHRGVRQGIAEVIFGECKTPSQINKIITSMKNNNQKNILITRVSKDKFEEINKEHPMTYYEDAKLCMIGKMPEKDGNGKVLVLTGGTGDIPVAEEAALTCQALGNDVTRLYDVGVAGIHRLLAHTKEIMNAQVIIAIAGMEGALASVVAGLSDCPVIGVPTSVGYGASYNGLSALLCMLNSCAGGVSVVNIDNGFGAGYLASMINHL